ncbi:hypothetical protein ACTWPF_01910 [Oceanobacillus sp. M65]|uniref:Sporulation lipoprotein YhcN/YlaJ (Spore_YhcN_YlaJ) n=1 Tax=Oceanobacillus jordanicus TaxID=2867266 RepID=A0AAW5AYJ0_9BACI|nr:hypothetical protein [Oceanobacillus jordanicus]AVR00765.1 hypothetical protein OBCHQ24_17725 [Oceanobacillus iheyensis]MCG3417751.1 hypothetical protein [Oceanobacillus jordanicus]
MKIGKMSLLIMMTTGLLAACTEGDNAEESTEQPNMEEVGYSHENMNDPDIIPGVSRDKKDTTNNSGSTYSGMGQNLYSTIGTSGVHEGGISSYFESILEGEGITGVKVFVVDDSVILARNKAENTSHEYDTMQRNLLSNTEGMSGKGEPDGAGNGAQIDDNLSQAMKKMDEMFNGNVKVLTVTNPESADLIEGIKEKIMDSSYEEASSDLLELLNMTE